MIRTVSVLGSVYLGSQVYHRPYRPFSSNPPICNIDTKTGGPLQFDRELELSAWHSHSWLCSCQLMRVPAHRQECLCHKRHQTNDAGPEATEAREIARPPRPSAETRTEKLEDQNGLAGTPGLQPAKARHPAGICWASSTIWIVSWRSLFAYAKPFSRDGDATEKDGFYRVIG